MIKRIALAGVFASTLLTAETIKDKGIFAGLDMSRMDATTAYRKSTNIPAFNTYDNPYLTIPVVSYKIGYQYYYTKIYFRMSNSYTVKDKKREKYSLSTKVYELDIDYAPILYRGKNRDWHLEGVIGVAAGVNESTLGDNYNKRLFDPMNGDGTVTTNTQDKMNLGVNIGVIVMADPSGVSLEAGYRFRSGLALEYFDTDASGNRNNEATFQLKTQEIYLGVNYLF